jgi:hypothetical protein
MSRLSLFACLACLAVCPGAGYADLFTYAVTDSGFGSLDLTTGAFTLLGGVRPGGFDGLGSLADGTLVAIDPANNFVRIDRTTGAVTVIGPTGINAFINASLFTGEQFALDNLNRLYRINPNTGAATLVGPTGLPAIGPTFANALAGDATSLYYVLEQPGPVPVTSALYRIDPLTGVATLLGPTGVHSLGGGGFADGTYYAYSGNFPVGTTHQIYSINLATGAATPGPTYAQTFQIFGSNSGIPAAVPEPGSLVLMALGGAVLSLGVWRRRQAGCGRGTLEA